ncbi:flagellar filament capping protein FliD [Massilia sp. GER05]|uniref:flagellar filament capping protein FliD n=1 Tax=Massilia sp. GER05 TaxID=3394605 RepID=UPI003F85675E
MATSAITAPTYDPTSTAKALADKYIEGSQNQLTTQSNNATATAKALTTLGSAISAFQTSLANLAGTGKSVLAQSATLSDTTIGTATANANAAAGAYSLFVETVATSSQVSYNSLADGAALGGKLTINLANEGAGTNTANFDVQLDASADTSGDGTLSVREIAAAINRASGNAGKVSAGIVTVGGVARLMLTSKNTGVANTISVDASNATDAGLQTGFTARTVVKNAQDAVVWLGDPADPASTRIQQASNTFTNIEGVSFTAAKAQAPGATPITLAVGMDTSGTTANAQAFIDAYNKLKSTIDGLVSSGDPANNVAAGIFAHDAGIRDLQNTLVNLLRPSGATSLASFGITGTRDGTLTLKASDLQSRLAIDPTGLDTLIGSSSVSAPTGIAGAMNKYLNQWSNAASGQIQQRTDAITKLQSDLSKRQTDLDAKYDAAYQRYLMQYTTLQTLQARMQQNSSMFSSLFSSDSSN